MSGGERCLPVCGRGRAAGEEDRAEDPTTTHRQRHATEQPRLRSYPTREPEALRPADTRHSEAGAIQ